MTADDRTTRVRDQLTRDLAAAAVTADDYRTTRVRDQLTRDLVAAEDLLRRGRWADGWAAWNAARAALAPYAPSQIPVGHATIGELLPSHDPRGVRVVVLYEGGAGDGFQTVRYAETLAAEGATVLWQTPPAMARLFRTVPGINVVDRATRLQPGFWVRAWSLPRRYAPSAFSSAPQRVTWSYPYLRASRWRWPRGLLASRPLVGVKTRSGPLTPGGVDRDVPSTAAVYLRRALYDSGFDVVDLDRPDGSSWDVTAAMIARCYAVVSVDTGVAHLAGALGANVHVLLPERADWRWGPTNSLTTAWYPSARLHWASHGWITAVYDAVSSIARDQSWE